MAAFNWTASRDKHAYAAPRPRNRGISAPVQHQKRRSLDIAVLSSKSLNSLKDAETTQDMLHHTDFRSSEVRVPSHTFRVPHAAANKNIVQPTESLALGSGRVNGLTVDQPPQVLPHVDGLIEDEFDNEMSSLSMSLSVVSPTRASSANWTWSREDPLTRSTASFSPLRVSHAKWGTSPSRQQFENDLTMDGCTLGYKSPQVVQQEYGRGGWLTDDHSSVQGLNFLGAHLSSASHSQPLQRTDLNFSANANDFELSLHESQSAQLEVRSTLTSFDNDQTIRPPLLRPLDLSRKPEPDLLFKRLTRFDDHPAYDEGCNQISLVPCGFLCSDDHPKRSFGASMVDKLSFTPTVSDLSFPSSLQLADARSDSNNRNAVVLGKSSDGICNILQRGPFSNSRQPLIPDIVESENTKAPVDCDLAFSDGGKPYPAIEEINAEGSLLFRAPNDVKARVEPFGSAPERQEATGVNTESKAPEILEGADGVVAAEYGSFIEGRSPSPPKQRSEVEVNKEALEKPKVKHALTQTHSLKQPAVDRAVQTVETYGKSARPSTRMHHHARSRIAARALVYQAVHRSILRKLELKSSIQYVAGK